jgi:hypothetical protein
MWWTKQKGVNMAQVNDLKEKVICEFKLLLSFLEKGHRLKYEPILEEISLINLIDESKLDLQDSLSYLEFYLNNEINTKWITF